MKKRLFGDEFKRMAEELSKVKNSVKEAAMELDPSRLSKWRNNPAFNGGKVMMVLASVRNRWRSGGLKRH